MRIRTLIVDDEPLARRRLRAFLRPEAEVEIVGECGNGAEAVEAVRCLKPQLMFLDVQMPGMDGFEVCRRLRADERTRRVPVLFLTATQFQVESRLRGLEVGADDFIVQPISNQELVARIK